MVLVVFAAMIPPRLRLPARERLPALVSWLALEKKLILPVLLSPSCKVCPLVVASVPVAVRYVALLLSPEILAVGVPEFTLMKANFADAVALDPSKRSCVGFLSKIA